MLKIIENLKKIKEDIVLTCQKSGKDSADIILVSVTKQIPVELILEAINNGITVIGENRVEEAKAKKEKLPKNIAIHMIGHLQTRKVKDAVRIFDLIHSVDSVKLAQEIDKRARVINKVQDTLIEVNISGEESKYGFELDNAITSIKEISTLENIKIKGLMTMAPFVNDSELTRPIFKKLRELRNQIEQKNINNIEMRYLSMGMSQDYIIAIEEGSNMVRIGSAIFK